MLAEVRDRICGERSAQELPLLAGCVTAMALGLALGLKLGLGLGFGEAGGASPRPSSSSSLKGL